MLICLSESILVRIWENKSSEGLVIATATNEFKREIKSFNLKGMLPANLIEDKYINLFLLIKSFKIVWKKISSLNSSTSSIIKTFWFNIKSILFLCFLVGSY